MGLKQVMPAIMITTVADVHWAYLRGVQSDESTFTDTILAVNTDPIASDSELLNKKQRRARTVLCSIPVLLLVHRTSLTHESLINEQSQAETAKRQVGMLSCVSGYWCSSARLAIRFRHMRCDPPTEPARQT